MKIPDPSDAKYGRTVGPLLLPRKVVVAPMDTRLTYTCQTPNETNCFYTPIIAVYVQLLQNGHIWTSDITHLH